MVQVERAGTPAAPVVSPPPPASAPAAPSMDFADNLASPKNMAEDLARKPEAADGTLGFYDLNVSSSDNGFVANNGTLTTSGGTLALDDSFTGELARNRSAAKNELGNQNTWSLGLADQPQRLKAAELQPSDAVVLNDNKSVSGVTRDDANGLRYLSEPAGSWRRTQRQHLKRVCFT